MKPSVELASTAPEERTSSLAVTLYLVSVIAKTLSAAALTSASVRPVVGIAL